MDVILQPMNLGQGLRMNSSLMLRVVQVNDSTAEGAAVDSTIPAGCYVLSANLNCDPALLSSLPEREYRGGCAEVIKYGILYDPDLFSHLEEKGLDFDREKVIALFFALKRAGFALNPPFSSA